MLAASGNPQKYRPDIDGLRAIAILIVVLYHLGRLSKGGYIGVDVFFVISGYLITSILIGDFRAGTYTLAGFYERRVRRILPALFACLFASAAVATYVLYPAELTFFAKSAVAATLFVANHFFLQHGGYFQPAVESMPLIHTWSLAVEEQFYVFFPLLLAPLLRRGDDFAKLAIAVLALASLIVSQGLVVVEPDSAFYLLVSRSWELMIGSLLALGAVPEVSSQRAREGLSALGLLAILGPAFAYNKNTMFPGLTALLPCLGAALLIHTGRHADTRAYRLLALRPMVGLGLISYSLYLWHVPIITFYRAEVIKDTPYSHKLFLLVVSVIVAALSWRFIERPFRNRVNGISARAVVGLAATSAVAVLGLAGVAILGRGLPERYPPEALRVAEFDYEPSEMMRDGTCFISRAAFKRAEFDAKTCLSLDPKRPDILIIGDSHAAHYWSGFSTAYPSINFLQATASGCSVDLLKTGSERCRAVMSHVFDDFLQHNRVDAVIVSLQWLRENLVGLDAVLTRLNAAADKVYVFGPIVRYESSLPRLLTRSIVKKDPTLIDKARRRRPFEIDAGFKEAFKDGPAIYISVLDAVCPGGVCVTTDADGLPLQHDASHLTAGGSAVVARRLGPLMGLTN